jgi:hypothetical protein
MDNLVRERFTLWFGFVGAINRRYISGACSAIRRLQSCFNEIVAFFIHLFDHLSAHFSWRRSRIRRVRGTIFRSMGWITANSGPLTCRLGIRDGSGPLKALKGTTHPKTESAGRSDSVRPPSLNGGLNIQPTRLQHSSLSTRQISCVFLVFLWFSLFILRPVSIVTRYK